MKQLIDTQTALFLCALREEEISEAFARSFPLMLRRHSAAEAWLGGRLIMSQHNQLIRRMLQSIMGSGNDVKNMRWQEAESFAATLNALS